MYQFLWGIVYLFKVISDQSDDTCKLLVFFLFFKIKGINSNKFWILVWYVFHVVRIDIQWFQWVFGRFGTNKYVIIILFYYKYEKQVTCRKKKQTDWQINNRPMGHIAHLRNSSNHSKRKLLIYHNFD